MRHGRFPNRKNMKADFKALLMIHHVAAVKEKSRFNHGTVDFSVIQIPVNIPVRQDQ